MEDVIVVVINYRQHVLGFLWMPSVGISGNTGLKDQQMALQWVHENISSFGGDPARICLFGESGGAGSVHYQVMNPKSRRFISSVILQSGSVINEWSFFGQNEETAKYLAKLLGGKGETAEDTLKTLMSASVRDLYDKCEKVLKPEEIEAGLRYKWRLVIEEESDDAFLTKSSLESIVSQAGQINLPMIQGTNNGDGMPNVASTIARKRLAVVNKNFHYNLPRFIPLKSQSEAMSFAEELKDFYFKGCDLDESTIEEYLKLRTDIDYLVPQTIATELNARHNPGCTQFLYEFQFDGRLNLQKEQMKLAHLPVAGHADDVFYLFGGLLADEVKIEKGSREDRIRRTMCKLWTNFAKFHDPTPDHDNPLHFKWTPLPPVDRGASKIDLNYLVINDDMRMQRDLNKARMDFWREVYRKYCDDYRKAKL
jgi:carboxylesterase type B